MKVPVGPFRRHKITVYYTMNCRFFHAFSLFALQKFHKKTQPPSIGKETLTGAFIFLRKEAHVDTRKWTLPVPFISRCQMIVFAEKVSLFL